MGRDRAHKYPKIGEKPQPDDPAGVYCMIMHEYLKALDPSKYFVTSGEAIHKAEQLNKDIWALAGKARKFLNELKKARGDAKYLESTWEDGIITLRRKNPRVKSAKQMAKKKTINKRHYR